MARESLKFRRQLLMGIAAVVLVAEIYHVGVRTPSPLRGDDKSVANSTVQEDHYHKSSQLVAEFLIPAGTYRQMVLVLGNLGSAFDGDLDVAVTATPHQPEASIHSNLNSEPDVALEARNASKYSIHSVTPRSHPFAADSPQLLNLSEVSSTSVRVRESAYGEIDDLRVELRDVVESLSQLEVSDDRRIYFIQSNRSNTQRASLQAPIRCFVARENSRVRIYVDESTLPNEKLVALINALDAASLSRLGYIVEELVGKVSDIDDDGRLAIVLTPVVDSLGTSASPVMGLTRSSDFTRGLERPCSNQSDVIFLSPKLKPGDELNAVLAHEWCHAAVFSRRATESQSDQVRTDDDWLNEALAHIVEIQATDCWNNVSHRILDFASRPESSPLVIRDYYHSEYWRHNGCRGAAFLFLRWCIDQAGDSLMEKLLSGPGCTMENLELAMGVPFSVLFRKWTESLGNAVANQVAGCGQVSNSGTPRFDQWDLSKHKSRTRRVHVRGVSSAFMQLTFADVRQADIAWRISVEASKPTQLQASLLPVRNCPKGPGSR